MMKLVLALSVTAAVALASLAWNARGVSIGKRKPTSACS